MKKHLRTWDIFNLSIYWFAISFHWGGLQAIVFPKIVLRYATETNQGTYLGILAMFGAVVSFLTNPLVGFISDRSAYSMGRRRPFVIFGTVFNVAALIYLATTHTYMTLIGAVLLIQFFSNIAQAPYAALIPDRVPEQQRGTAASFMGIFQFLGNGVGIFAAGMILGADLKNWLAVHNMEPFMTFMLATSFILVMCGAMTVAGVKEETHTKKESYSLREMLYGAFHMGDVLQKPSFAWLMLTRFFVNMGMFTMQVFLYYYVKDVLKEKNVENATRNIMIMALTGALPSAIVCGILSDRMKKRKLFVYISCIGMTVVSLFFMNLTSYRIALGVGLFFGLAIGAFTTVDWALACDLLPETDSAAKHMGIWNYAGVGPQVIAPAIGGVLLDQFNKVGPNFGYKVLFASVIVYMFLGTYFLKNVHEPGARRHGPAGGEQGAG